MTNLFLQTSGILVPIFIYQIFWNRDLLRPTSLYGKAVFTTFLILSLLACMSFGVPLAGYHYDMRDIPLFLTILYGGFDVGAVVAALEIVYRFYVGGFACLHGSLASLAVHAIVLPIVFMAGKRYSTYTHEQRVRVATGLGCYFSIVAIMVSIGFEPQSIFLPNIGYFYLVFGFANTLGMTFVVFLMEKNRENESLKDQLQASDKLQVVSHLAASIAHEVRNPLTVVKGFVQLLVSNEIDDGKKQLYGTLVMEELGRAQAIITDYLTLARPEVDVTEAVASEVKPKILTAVNVMQPFAAAHSVAFVMDLADDLCVRMEKHKFIQVIVNMLKNAIEAMPVGGTIEIRSSKVNNNLVIDIIDQGIGMSDDQLKRLGYPFYSTKERGTGLGLMVSYRIVQSLGGEIKVTSEPGNGTHFQIIVPLAGTTEHLDTRSTLVEV